MKSAFLLLVAALGACSPALWAATTGSVSGVLTDPSGAVIPGATIIAVNPATGLQNKTTTDEKGFYAFPSLPIGRYDLSAEAPGFRPGKRPGVTVDADSRLEANLTVQMIEKMEEVTVIENELRVETESTQMGEVVTGSAMTAVALNGRSYTDLMALQPGIVPATTQQADSIVMAGVTTAIAPSGVLNAGNQSINGQREDANGFIVNGGDVKELMNGGTLVVPNLDSIAEFRILTNNFDAEYGNYSGGVVNVVTKSGTNVLHGNGFEFLRNTDLDARNYFSPERSFYRQNQFGGTVGGPVKKNQIFFFGDYQGTRQSQGIDTGLIAVPSAADRVGNLADQAASLAGQVSGPYLANLLSQKLGYGVSAGEPYYLAGCAVASQCVFPNAMIPMRAWSAPALHLLQYIPAPNAGSSTFSTASDGQTLRDDKASFRADGSSQRFGLISGYYYFDDYALNNPYPRQQGGASVPGFNALNLGRAQLFTVADTKTFGASTVNELRLSAMRNSNNLGQPSGGVGPSLASQGFVTGVGTPGIVPLAPSIEGVENVVFNSFTMGTPITNLKQANNTFSAMDHFSKVRGAHTLKFGGEFSYEQVNVNPNATFNGSFLFTGSETGSDFADFLIGAASNYNQADSEAYYGRHKYAAAFLQDSWRARSNLTLNLGVRWDLMEYWSEKYNQIPTFILGEQSKVYPTAPASLVYPTDPGVPKTLVPAGNRFAPRLGVAYSPSTSTGLLGKMIGGPAKTSIRAGYGIFYSVIQGNTIGIDEPQPPYGLSYTSSGRPLFATPFINASDGTVHVNPFPLTFPPLNATSSNPNPNIDFSPFIPQAGMDAPPPSNTYPYNENYFLSIERQLVANSVLSLSYVGSQAHHLLTVVSANPGIPALCLGLSDPSAVKPHTSTCGPFGENNTYVTAAGQTIRGTRGPLGPNFQNDSYLASMGNSSYSAFEASLRRSGPRLDVMVSYTFSKSIDQSSSLADPLNPYNYGLTRALSAWDLTHNLVTTYRYQLPFDRLFRHAKGWADGWSISGITRASSGFPVTMHSDGDNSLLGSIPNGVNNHSIDLPDYNGGPLQLNGNPRNGLPYFNVSAFSLNALGTPGSASRRSFHGPGALNFDVALLKSIRLSESKALQFRLETFNTFNHTQFFGPAAVDGGISTALFGHVVNAAPPRLAQLALKFTF
ncbi:MAG TPA: carboxypeptidase regulatory-like domain-containing protein [Bryobacteraceae bacterium]|nr:carboxypeptidase regulatory-like domain-containing protein [Bryobacteraceae bacterium]